jgi:hypothetical protein
VILFTQKLMATLIPSFTTCRPRMTPGERWLAQRLETFLEDDYLIWYDVPIGPKQLHPNFLILHPAHPSVRNRATPSLEPL